MSGSRFTENDIDEMVRLYVEEKWSIRRIARKVGASYNGVRHRIGPRVVFRGPGGAPSTHSESKVAETAEAIRQRIIRGEWKPRTQIPNQLTLRKMFDVPERTITQAIADLRRRGYVGVAAGVGAFVHDSFSWKDEQPNQKIPGTREA